MHKYLIIFAWFLSSSCGYVLISNKINDFNIEYSLKSNNDSNLTKKRIIKKLNSLTNLNNNLDYECIIEQIKINNSQIAINSDGEANNYKFEVTINFQLYDSNKNLVFKDQFIFLDIYSINNSLYSSEVKIDNLTKNIYVVFNEYINNQIILNEI